MNIVKVSEFSNGGYGVTGDEILPLVQGGISKRATLQEVSDLLLPIIVTTVDIRHKVVCTQEVYDALVAAGTVDDETEYDIFEDVTYSVLYDGNGNTSGDPPVDNGVYVFGDTVIVLNNNENLAKTGYTFNGWNTAADGSGTSYQADASPAETFLISNNIVLYAIWV